MIGTVEIYSNYGTPQEELLHTENNLIVNGAGEALCDMLTMPSSTSNLVEGLSDSSNFTVQAISFGKSSNAYKNNAHFFPFDVSAWWDLVPAVVEEITFFSGSPEFEGYVSAVRYDNVIRAVSLVNENIDSTTSSYDPKRDPGSRPNPNDTKIEPNTETAIDVVSGQAHRMGDRMMQGRAHAYGHNLNKIKCSTNPNLISFTDGPPTDEDFGNGNNYYWSSSLGGISSVELQSKHSGPIYGTSSFLVSAATNAQLVHMIPPYKTALHPNVDHTFSFYAKQPGSSLGVSGTTSAVILNIRDTTNSLHHMAGMCYYDEENSLFGAPSAFDRTKGSVTITHNGAEGFVTPGSGADGSAGWYKFEVVMEGGKEMGALPAGAEIRVQCKFLGAGGDDCPLEMYGWQLEERYGSSEYKRVTGLTPSYNEGGIDGDLFLGCYPHTSGTDYAILNSISNIELLSDYIEINGTYPNSVDAALGNNFFNSSAIRSMDENGFIKAYYPTGDFDSDGPVYPSSLAVPDPASGLIVSADSDFSSTGEVLYLCTISSGDLGLANMYGGIFKAGLWTIDLEKTLSDKDAKGHSKIRPTFPLRFSSSYNRLVYRLFAEKTFTKNLAAIKDDTTINTPGCFSYGDLTLVWRLRFI